MISDSPTIPREEFGPVYLLVLAQGAFHFKISRSGLIYIIELHI